MKHFLLDAQDFSQQVYAVVAKALDGDVLALASHSEHGWKLWNRIDS